MKKTFNTIKRPLVLGVALGLSALNMSSAFANNISLDQLTADITYLASNELKGRASFSPEIMQAANYIDSRFSEIGLSPINKLTTFKQTFAVTNIQPKTLSITLNGKALAAENTAMASTMQSIAWNSKDDVATHVIGKDDNMRGKLRELNNLGGQHLVLIHSAHSKTFAGYKGYFQKGLTKLSLKDKGAIVMALTDDATINNLKVSATTQISEKSLTNVVGVLPGKTKPKEMVLYSAHYDHIGLSADGKEIFNGADDDASGTSAIINLATYFAKQANNERTLVFSAFTAEEIGGFGSRYFSEQLNPDDVIAMINIEMIGKPSKFGAGKVWMTGMERSNLGELLNVQLKEKSMEIYADPYPKQGLFYRSDNATLARLGVPAHSFSSTQLDKDQHYHKTTDDISTIDLASMHTVVESLSIATEGLVNGSITPTRVDVSKVRGRGKIF